MLVSSTRTRRGLLVLAASAAVGAVVAACGPSLSVERVEEKSSSATKAVERIEITTVQPRGREGITITADCSYVGHYVLNLSKIGERMLDLWQKTHKTRVVTNTDQCRYYNRDLAKAIAGDTIGDVTPAWPNALLFAIEKGVYADITSNLKAINYDHRDFVPHEWAYTHQGRYLGLPFAFFFMDWIANRTLIEKFDARVPDSHTWTWDDLVPVGQKVTAPDKYCWGTVPHWSPTWLTAVHSFGGRMLSQDGQKTLMAEGPGPEAWQMIHDWIFKWKISPTMQQAIHQRLAWKDATQAFGWGVARGKDLFECVQMLPPRHPKTGLRFSTWDATPQAVTTWAKKRDVLEETFEFLVFQASKDVAQIMVEEGGSPARMSVIDTDAYAPKATRDIIKESNKNRLTEGCESTKYLYEWYAAVYPILQKMFDGELGLKEALAKASELGDRALATGEAPST